MLESANMIARRSSVPTVENTPYPCYHVLLCTVRSTPVSARCGPYSVNEHTVDFWN